MTGRPTTLQVKLNELKARKHEIEQEIARLSEKFKPELNKISNELSILEHAQALLEGRATGNDYVAAEESNFVIAPSAFTRNGDTDWSKFDASSIKGLNKQQAFVKMAEWSGGVIKMKEIGQVLLDGEQSSAKTPWQASAQAYGSINTSRNFRKSGRGEYTLVR